MKYVLTIILICGIALGTVFGLAFAQRSQPITLSPELETRARNLGLELKCPVCQGSAIGESPSEFARSMMAELRSQVKAGKSDAEITQYFVTRYGEDVRLKPNNPFIWILPGAVVILGGFALVSYLRRASGAKPLVVNSASLERVRQDLKSLEVEP